MRELSPKISEIIIKSTRNDFGVVDVYSYKAASSKERKFGNIFIVSEVRNDASLATPVINTIITVFKKEYYRVSGRDIFESFKIASHKTNEELASLAEKGNVSWIGNLHLIIAAQKGNETHLTATGKAKAFLIRNKKATEITEGAAFNPDAVNPLKTFTDVVSGGILPHDKIILSTPFLFEILPEERIHQVVSREKPREATFSIQTLINKAGIENVNLAAFIIEFEEETISSSPLAYKEEFLTPLEAVEARMPRKPKLTPEEFRDKLQPKNIFIIVFSFLGTILLKVLRLIFAGVKIVFQKIASGIKFLAIRIIAKIKARRQKINDVKEEEPKKTEKLEEVVSPLLPKPNEIFIKEEKEKRPMGLVFLSFWKKLPSSSKFFLLTSLVLVVLFISSLFLLYHKKKIENETSQVMDFITLSESKLEKAETALIYNDEEKARNLLNEASSFLEQASKSERYKEETENLSSKIQEKKDLVNHITRISEPRILGNFSESFPGVDFSYIAVLNGKIYTFNPQNNAIYRLDTETKNIETVSQTSQGVGYFKAALALPSDKMILFFTDTPGLAMLDAKNNDLLPLEIDFGNKEREIVSLALFANRLYLLDKKNNELLSFAKTLSGYTGGNNWLKENIDLSEIRDLAVDGYVYLLFADGRVEKYLKGVKKEFETPTLSEGLKNPSRLFLNENIKHMYILEPEGKRVLVLDTVGNLNDQYVIENATNLRDIFIDNNEEKMYLLDEGKVLEVEIK